MNTSSKFVVAVHILTLLSSQKILLGEKSLMKSDIIARGLNTNPVVIRRLLSLLKAKKLVDSKAGPSGGFYFKYDPSTVTLAMIHDIVEPGNLYHMYYSSPNKECPFGSHIHGYLKTLLCSAEASFKNVLAEKSLLDLVNDVLNKVEHKENLTKEEFASELKKNMKAISSKCSQK